MSILKNLYFDSLDKNKFLYGYNTIKESIKYMEKNYWKALSLEHYTKQLNISATAFIQNFKKYFHYTPHAYLNKIRLEQSKHLLLTTEFSITEIAIQVGFIDPLHFCKFFKKETTMPPSKYRKIYSNSKFFNGD